jgi:hypothetical protein
MGAFAQPTKDSHRPACTDSVCRAARAYVKAHYCGESPYGNGPDDGCEVIPLKHLSPGTSSVAKYKCEFDDKTNKPICKQLLSPPPEFRGTLLDQMHKIGLPKQDDGKVLFSVLTSTSAGWSVLEAYYQQLSGESLTLCQLVAAIGPDKEPRVLRKVRFQTTDSDMKTVTTWSPVDISTVGGQQELVLQGDLYEDHWFEAFGIENGVPKIIFSGLGYYL